MKNVQWKDPARRVHRLTPVETKAGRPRDAWSIRDESSARRVLADSFDGPRCEGLQLCRGFKELIMSVIPRRLP